GIITADKSVDPFISTIYKMLIIVSRILILTHFWVVRKLKKAILLSIFYCTIYYIRSLNRQKEVLFIGCDLALIANLIAINEEGKE
ncbi:uncharacterized protein K460DRAFT_272672, partial [Cucurbitaria berberidis CBS 394.84]